MITKKPAPTPKQNLIVFFNPYLFANSMAMMLFGPGVKLVIKTNSKKDSKGMIDSPLYVIMTEIDIITISFLLYNVDVIL